MAKYEVRVELEGYTLTTEIEIGPENDEYDLTEQEIYNEIMDSMLIEWDKVGV